MNNVNLSIFSLIIILLISKLNITMSLKDINGLIKSINKILLYPYKIINKYIKRRKLKRLIKGLIICNYINYSNREVGWKVYRSEWVDDVFLKDWYYTKYYHKEISLWNNSDLWDVVKDELINKNIIEISIDGERKEYFINIEENYEYFKNIIPNGYHDMINRYKTD